MLDLPIGVITEKRRGGPSVLSLLAKDLIGSKVDSYVRTEIKSAKDISRIGYVVFRNGNPLMAMHAEEKIHHAANALEKIDDDAAELDCLLTVHRNIDVDLLLQTFPESLLNLEINMEFETKSEWWKEKEISSKSWTSSKALPEQKFQTNNSPEFERAIEAKLRRLKGGKSNELYPGHAYLVADANPSNSFKLASKLHEIEHELMIISRLPGSRISEENKLPKDMCYWLTEKKVNDEQIMGPQLEVLYSKIKDFFMNYPRSVVVLDGFEFLYAIHGKDRALDFLRRLVDIATTSDDLALIPINLNAFDPRSKSLIKRELDLLNNEDLEDWLLSPEDLEGHLFHLPDQQEILWDEELKTKKAPIKKEITPQNQIPDFTELMSSENNNKKEINNEGSRLDLSGIIEKWDEEDSKSDEKEPIMETLKEVDEESIEEHIFSRNGPKEATKVRLLGTKQKSKKSAPKHKKSSLEEATKVIMKNENKITNNNEWKKKDRNKTYRQYYDASKHKGKTGGED
ncbi:MAG: DUF835 domain-containing protein [Candidatus Thermoplasmatota archaeon]|nr:DUF835 domain-containing protein [Candidatus Thermoplasmatota archaeon]